jgi:hypothetical protein
MWFHASIVQLFRPFARDQTQIIPERSFHSSKEIFTASLNQLKHLVIVFRHTFPRGSCAILWHIALLHVANWALHNTTDPQWQSYFTLCLDSFTDLFVGFRTSGGIAKSLVSIALRLGVMQPAEARGLIDQMYSSVTHNAALKQTGIGLIVDLDLALDDRKAAQIDNLCECFDNSLLEEFIAMD